MKWIDFYIIMVVMAILRLTIQSDLLFVLSGLPVGIVMGVRRANLNVESIKVKKDEEK